jgi:hypothetical protein
MFIRCWQSAILVVCGFVLVSQAWAQTYTLNPDNGHYYTVEQTELTWEQARVSAIHRSFAGVSGHLLTITSATEQAFAATAFFQDTNKYWLGGFQPAGSPEPDGNWQWVTGEPFIYTHWKAAEPNNRNNNEDRLEMLPFFVEWNDVAVTEGTLPGLPPGPPTRRYFVIEFSVPEPASLLIAASSAIAVGSIRRRRA